MPVHKKFIKKWVPEKKLGRLYTVIYKIKDRKETINTSEYSTKKLLNL